VCCKCVVANVLQCVANVLQCVANVLQMCRSVLHCVEVHGSTDDLRYDTYVTHQSCFANVLQCVANVLQCAALQMCCSVLQICCKMCCSVLQMCCSVLLSLQVCVLWPMVQHICHKRDLYQSKLIDYSDLLKTRVSVLIYTVYKYIRIGKCL